MKTLQIFKIGGNSIDNNEALNTFLTDFTSFDGSKILVHGGGKLTTDLAQKLNIKQTLIDGRRITDEETLNLAVMVYGGLINKKIVAILQSKNCNSIGLSGADANLIISKKRVHPTIDFGFVGDVVSVNTNAITQFIESRLTLVICAITHDENGNLLNTNADTIATKLAIALNKNYDVNLNFCFEKDGVLLDPSKDDSLLKSISKQQFQELKSGKIISKGMIPKLENAFEAHENGVKNVAICNVKNVITRNNNFIGTKISN